MADDTKVSNVGERYAQALFDLANDQKQIAAVEADIKSLKAAIADSRDLRILLQSPAFGAEDKGKGLVAIGVLVGLVGSHLAMRRFLRQA